MKEEFMRSVIGKRIYFLFFICIIAITLIVSLAYYFLSFNFMSRDIDDRLKGAVYFEEARLVLECRKLYFQDLDPEHFLDRGLESNYPHKDYHRMYVGEITECLAGAGH